MPTKQLMNAGLDKRTAYLIPEKRRNEILDRIRTDRANKDIRTAKMRKRQKVGLEIAKEAAHILKEQFHVTKVALFGSLLGPERMHERSDIDIAVWGLDTDQLLTVWSTLNGQIDLREDFPYIDVIPVETAVSYIRESIEAEHFEL